MPETQEVSSLAKLFEIKYNNFESSIFKQNMTRDSISMDRETGR